MQVIIATDRIPGGLYHTKIKVLIEYRLARPSFLDKSQRARVQPMLAEVFVLLSGPVPAVELGGGMLHFR